MHLHIFLMIYYFIKVKQRNNYKINRLQEKIFHLIFYKIKSMDMTYM
jgi:hypothetical protein